ncbi:histidine phosphatase family protein [Streptomyces sp. NPDC004288]|uniref:histidine phosphatase family protein n=1 Tax=unclassified Streptomyces TaxID=2593676 RepID=UPI002E75CD57|nr:histidine phosphatase family protein [Streptomyces sp. SP18ES09]MEE1815529.1 histidine phosphatase family protein [Streptomyces sp. SP18ES09]
MGDLLLIRHGETEWSASGRHTGRTDLPLTPDGEAEARTLAPFFAGRSFAFVLTSPLRRARHTAELAGLRGAVTDEDLCEWDYGGYEGLTTARIHETRPDWSLWRDGVPPHPDGRPGESATDVGRRADRVLARLAPRLAGSAEDGVVVAHAHLLRVLTARYLELPASEGRLFLLTTATVGRLSTEHGLPVVAGWNQRPLPRA